MSWVRVGHSAGSAVAYPGVFLFGETLPGKEILFSAIAKSMIDDAFDDEFFTLFATEHLLFAFARIVHRMGNGYVLETNKTVCGRKKSFLSPLRQSNPIVREYKDEREKSHSAIECSSMLSSANPMFVASSFSWISIFHSLFIDFSSKWDLDATQIENIDPIDGASVRYLWWLATEPMVWHNLFFLAFICFFYSSLVSDDVSTQNKLESRKSILTRLKTLEWRIRHVT